MAFFFHFMQGFTYQYLDNLKIAIDNGIAFHYSGYLVRTLNFKNVKNTHGSFLF